ncbi:CRTAC1 family protein [Planctobacterium marinum]|uniref:ASPIC/UnbV domain-containing protein n=1 Tax=Planctobacterium marinum TaxID=1631968 RepID=A0AA48HGB6_9ALTE|nr:hypothetical protein MACH26_03300 [Planctobacterium marinum]
MSSKFIVSALTLAFLSGCGGGGSDTTPPVIPTPATPTTPPPVEDTGPRIDVITLRTSANQLAAGGCAADATSSSGPFSDISQAAGLCYEVNTSPEDGIPARVAGGIAVQDVNQDGYLDIYVTHGRDTKGKLFSLSAEDNFTDITVSSGINVSATDHSAAFVDVDQDGLSDLLSIQEASPWLQIFKNAGDGSFTEISDTVALTLSKDTYSVAASDIDNDNDLDLFFAHWHPDNPQNRWEFLWENRGPNQYHDISDTVDLEEFDSADADAMADQFSFTPVFADINLDQFPDLLLAADWSTSQVLVNNGGSSFVDQTVPAVINDRAGMGGTVADYDNDGDLDWFVSAIGDPREEFLTVGLFDGNRLYRNEGDGTFLNMTDYADVRQGYWAWGACFADVNNDGFDDLFIVNGYNGWTEEQAQSGNFAQFLATPARLYINQQDGTFEEQTEQFGITHTDMGRGLVCYDYDRDGDIDLMIANSGKSPTLYRNDSAAQGNGFINIQLQGLLENPEAVGAKIYVRAGDLTLFKELQLGNHYVSQNPVEAHFGLGDNATIEEIRIVWPGNAAEETIVTNIASNQFIRLYHPHLETD